MNDVVFEYRLTGDGFFDTLFRVGDAELDLRQLGDSPHPLDELMTAALALAQDEEPPPQLLWDPADGEYRWRFTRNADGLQIHVAHADATTVWDVLGESRGGRTALDAECLAETFCTVVGQRAAEVIARYGPERYAALALGSYPFELCEALQAAVALRPEQDGAGA